jgi:hypothetical protein
MSTPHDDDPLDEAAKLALLRDFAINEAKFAQAKEAYTSSRAGLLKLLPKAIGDHELVIGPWKLEIKYPEKVEWKADELEALYGADKPAHVKASYSIDLRVLRKLPKTEQDNLQGCYEIKPGTPAITLEKN